MKLESCISLKLFFYYSGPCILIKFLAFKCMRLFFFYVVIDFPDFHRVIIHENLYLVIVFCCFESVFFTNLRKKFVFVFFQTGSNWSKQRLHQEWFDHCWNRGPSWGTAWSFVSILNSSACWLLPGTAEHEGEGRAAPLLPLTSRGKGAKMPFLCVYWKIFSHFLHSLICKARSTSILRNSSPGTKCVNRWKHMFVKSCPYVKILASVWHHNQFKCPFPNHSPPTLLLLWHSWILFCSHTLSLRQTLL